MLEVNPDLQSVQDVGPFELPGFKYECLPAGQSLQVADPCALMYLPDGQGVQAAAYALENLPGPQFVQDTTPAPLYLPATQAPHDC